MNFALLLHRNSYVSELSGSPGRGVEVCLTENTVITLEESYDRLKRCQIHKSFSNVCSLCDVKYVNVGRFHDEPTSCKAQRSTEIGLIFLQNVDWEGQDILFRVLKQKAVFELSLRALYCNIENIENTVRTHFLITLHPTHFMLTHPILYVHIKIGHYRSSNNTVRSIKRQTES